MTKINFMFRQFCKSRRSSRLTFSRLTLSSIRRFAVLVSCLLPALILAACGYSRKNMVVVGSKNFPESAILGELLAQHIEARTGLHVERRFYLAGTYICQQAILAGRIDMYVEYTGTALTAILKDPVMHNPAAVYDKVKTEYARRFNLVVEKPLGFNDTFAIIIRGSDAQKYHLKTISDVVPYAVHWRAGFGYEFMERPDGYKGLVRTYGLKFASPPRIMDLGLLYRALIDKQVDLVAGNSTDGVISALHLVVLKDNKHYFPPYWAVPIVRPEVLRRHPKIQAALDGLAGKISAEDMRHMNYAVVAEHHDMKLVVKKFLEQKHLDTAQALARAE